MTFTSSFRKSHCPFCNATFHLGQCALVSNIIPGKVLRQSPRGIFNRLSSRIRTDTLHDPAYSDVLVSPQCPQCKKPLPYDNLSIIVLGNFMSGKHYYVTA